MQLRKQIKEVVKKMYMWRIAKLGYKLASPLINEFGTKTFIGGKLIDANKETIIIVSHEASITGAPILALNICKELGKRYNIVSVILRNGELGEEFRTNSQICILPRFGIFSSGMLRKSLSKINIVDKPKYAIVNSIVSAKSIQPLRQNGIPVMTLVHEFSAYIRPINLMEMVGMWSNALVFSSELTKQDILENSPVIRNCKTLVIPQGKCGSISNKGKNHLESEIFNEAENYIKNLKNETILILGAGQIQPRKGVDLFISVASHILKNNKEHKIEFIWIGDGYDPINDFNISLWLKDQIKRSGLKDKMQIFGSTDNYSDFIKRANIFLVTSRLDPLPNVAIDAIYAKTPTYCFQDACGLADLYRSETLLGGSLIADYCDTNHMANLVNKLIGDKERYNKIADLCAEKAKIWFDMKGYANKIDKTGNSIENIEKQMKSDYNYLLKGNNLQYTNRTTGKARSTEENTKEYLMRWQNEIWPKRPEPGLHPGIYKDIRMGQNLLGDPYVHYIKNGKPNGPWKQQLITRESIVDNNKLDLKVGVHIHIYYPELVYEILQAFSTNSIKPEIHVTYSEKKNRSTIESIFESQGKKYDSLIHVPNRGRDIGPLITELGCYMDKNYEIYGHFHTKKSVLISNKDSIKWRNFLLKNLVGYDGSCMADKILTEMVKDKTLGLVFPEDQYCVGWGSNYERAVELSKKIGITRIPRNLNFPIGNMFWVRSGALKTLYELNLSWDDYPLEPIGYDGTILHAIERLLPIIAESNGYSYRMTYVSGVSR